MIPKTYQHNKLLRYLEDEKYSFVQNDTELYEFLDMVGFPKRQRKHITGMVLLIGDGDIVAVWVTERGAYYDLSAIYHPLPYYRPGYWTKRNLPDYWKEENSEYQREIIK